MEETDGASNTSQINHVFARLLDHAFTTAVYSHDVLIAAARRAM
jgi:hypothetical protein